MKRDAKPQIIKRILFEPIAPYFADAYNTLFSIVQGLALGVYGYEITRLFFENDSDLPNLSVLKTAIVFKLIIAFLSICVLWHRYITHNQFYAWRLGVFDTVIPMVFGLIEILLILSISKAFICFASFLAGLSTWGIVAYINTIHRHNDPPENPNAKVLYRKHFAALGDEFADAFFGEITRFEKTAQIQLIITALVLWANVLLIQFSPISKPLLETVFLGLATAVLFYMLIFDLWRKLERSPKLQKFWRKLQEN